MTEDFDTRFQQLAREQEARLEAEGGFWLSDEDQALIVAIAEGSVPLTEEEARRWCETHEMHVAPYLIPALWQGLGVELPERRGYDVSGWKFIAGKPNVRIHAVGKTLVEAVARAKAQYDDVKERK